MDQQWLLKTDSVFPTFPILHQTTNCRTCHVESICRFNTLNVFNTDEFGPQQGIKHCG